MSDRNKQLQEALVKLVSYGRAQAHQLTLGADPLVVARVLQRYFDVAENALDHPVKEESNPGPYLG